VISRVLKRLSKTTDVPLEPPPTTAELAWWSDAKKPIRRAEMLRWTLLIQVPTFLGGEIRQRFHDFSSLSGLAFIVLVGGTSGLVCGWMMWAGSQAMKRRQAIVAKRLREGILAPGDDLPDDDSRNRPVAVAGR
jgi:hypothetical protein